ncbi:hypothetical protein SAMN03159463_04510 [Mesorhizobium sp. NFR06]|uniref:hypothetical protein n=1 Tax=Mesorhizobium sp. NFR06 TaxID=1566290 RepID=UPI0008ED433E|nr:hypothetical protein [Mesorhizobium sp. NFR06]SFP58347.1 hypothetical protein SAMN03159463_04510 [Mesorhizobium sp. NFR06]
MAIPHRLAAEYPSRYLQLINAVEGFAREQRLVGSFSLLAAAAVLTIPFERAQARHFLHRERDDQMMAAIGQLSKVKFVEAPFWQGESPGDWRQSHIVKSADSVEHWVARDGKHPLAKDAEDFLPRKRADEVLRAIRNALAHRNIVYLNKDGEEREGDQVHYLAFLSRYEEGADQQAKAETYRVVVTTEDEFLRFIRLWAAWISGPAINDREMQAA